MRTSALVALLALLGACADPAPPSPPDAPPPAPGAASWSRDALVSAGGRPRAHAPASLGSADPVALAELLAAAPDAGLDSTGEDGRTKIGSETGVPATAEPGAVVEPAAEPGRPRVTVGPLDVKPQMATPAIERVARAQLYWPLVQRCRDAAGKILPADAIALSFTIDPEGYLVPTSIVATAADPHHEEAAACMRRELSGAPFRAPPASRGLTTRVDARVPSVD